MTDPGRNESLGHETLNQLIEQAYQDLLSADATYLTPGATQSESRRDRAAFFAAIQTPWQGAAPTWRPEAFETADWFTAARALASRLSQQAGAALKAELDQFETILNVLSDRMTPAPSHRGPAMMERMTYPAQRRAIPAADLPAFHPLFCTAVHPEDNPFRLHGLDPHYQYRLTLTAPGVPGWKSETMIDPEAESGARIDLSPVFDSDAGHTYIWHLSQQAPGTKIGAWLTGMVWQANQANSVDEFNNRMTDTGPRPVKLLMEINRLYCGGMLVEAYERTRVALRNESLIAQTGGSAPYSEALWLMVEKCLDAMIDRLEPCEKAFQALQPEWNATESLRSLRRTVSGR